MILTWGLFRCLHLLLYLMIHDLTEFLVLEDLPFSSLGRWDEIKIFIPMSPGDFFDPGDYSELNFFF